MDRKVILYIAMTLDGYIADENDQLSFLDPYNENDLAKKSYQELMDQTDILLIGRKTYDVVSKLVTEWPYPNHHTYVFTTNPRTNTKNITYTNKDMNELIIELKMKPGKDIWLVGGGKLVQSMIEHDLIDEYQIAIIPIILGKGIPLFHETKHQVDLIFNRVEHENGMVFLTYKKH